MKSPKLKIAINGFGRIGRNVLRAYLERFAKNPQTFDFDIVAINDIADAETLLYLLKYDSTHGRLHQRIDLQIELQTEWQNDTQYSHFIIKIANKILKIAILQQPNPTKIDWKDYQVDLVLESTGHFRSYEQAYQHITAGANQVIIGSAPFDRVDASIVLGVNDSELSRNKPILSSVSCTTQAVVPLLYVLDNAFGIDTAMMTEIHAVTADQTVLDQAHRDFRRGRASGHNIVPTTSSSIGAVGRVLPNMIGKINGYSIRVPTVDVAVIDVNFVFKKPTNIDKINQVLKQASEQDFADIMGFSDEPLVSSDFIHEPYSLVIDSLQTMSVGNTNSQQFKVLAWYDNEWGYANRMLDICQKLAIK